MYCPPRFLSMAVIFSCIAAPTLLRADKVASGKHLNTQHLTPEHPTPNTFKGTDVLATVEGESITRRELTNLWIKIDNQANRPLGMILMNRIRAAGGITSGYSVSEADIYKALFSGPTADYATYLSNLVTNRLVAHEAKRKGVIVTQAESAQAGHALMQQVREQQGLKLTDEQILTKFHVPRDIYLEEMTFRLRGERLLAKSIEARNGHPLKADDWLVLRQLFAGANVGTNEKKNAQEFADAKTRVQTWAGEVKAGKPFADIAKAHNEDETRNTGGYRGPALRGTGTKEIEEAVFRLKSGELSAPLRTKDGWYVFQVEKRGAQISEKDRAAAWKQITEKRVTPFLADLRKHAKITSVIPLPADTIIGQTPASK